MSNVLNGIPSPVGLRAKLEEMVVGDLLGPAGGPDEELTERNVRDRYLVGVLAPRKRAKAMLLSTDFAAPLVSLLDGHETRRIFAGPQLWREVLKSK